MEFEFFNKIEFVEFLKSLPIKQRKKLISDIKLVETHDRLWSFQHEKMKLINRKEEIYEIRSKFSSNIQRVLLFHKVGNKYVITNCFTKKTNRTPLRESNKAIKRKRLYKG